MTRYPLLHAFDAGSPLAWTEHGAITCRTFLSQVAAVSESLPGKSHVINLCEDRYLFLVGLAAALCRGQVTLLPPGRAPETVQHLADGYRDGYCLTDKDHHVVQGYERRRIKVDTRGTSTPIEPPAFESDQPAVIAFTSGSTGRPRPHPKTWGGLVEVARKTGESLGWTGEDRYAVVATVPPQHMYGLEASVMLPLQHGSSVGSARPFFPEDVRRTLDSVPGRRVLITTPLHLRALVSDRTRLPRMELVLSATAPLPVTLAGRAEAALGCRVMEVYGFVEGGTIAVRHPVEREVWRLLEGLRVARSRDGHVLHAPYLAGPVPLPDLIAPENAREFALLGRKAEFVNIAGHRVALGHLNQKLVEIEGVLDGVFYVPDEVEGEVARPTAIVVAPGKREREILSELRAKIDPVFLPRELIMVDELPRNETGKLPREALVELATRQLVRTQSGGTHDGSRDAGHDP